MLGGAAVVPGTAPWVNAQPHERQACERAWKQSRESSAPFVVEFRIGTPNGETLWVQVATQPIREGNNITGYVGTAIDCTTAVEQRRLSDQLVGLLDASGDAIVVFDRVGTMTFCNDIARTMLGLEEHSESGNDIAARTFMQAVRDQLPRDVISPDAGGTPQGRWEGEVAFRSPEGLSSILAVVVQAVRTREGVLDHWSAIARDITEERNQQRELGRLATHDALTGLPNRVLFLRKTAEAIERSRTTKNHVTVLFIDLDKLKHVNDTIGHVVGDQLIVSIAKRLMADPKIALETLVREELGLDPEELGSPWGASIGSFLAFAVGAFVPLLPFILLSGSTALLVSIALTAAALFSVGAAVSLLTGKSAIYTGLRQLAIGAAAAAITYAVGSIIGVNV